MLGVLVPRELKGAEGGLHLVFATSLEARGLEPHKPTYYPSRASSSRHKLWLEPDSSQARYFCDISLPNLSSQIWQRVRPEETGGDGRKWEEVREGGGGGYYNKKNPSRYSEAGKRNFNIGEGFPAAGPTLILKGWLGSWEVEDLEIKLDAEESQVEEVDRLFRDHTTHIWIFFFYV